MAGDVALGPMRVAFTGPAVIFRFSDPGAMMLEIPGRLESAVRELLAERQSDFAGREIVVDLNNLPALTSRQLGILLMLREVCLPLGPVALRNVSPPVGYLLQLTKMRKLFQLPADSRE